MKLSKTLNDICKQLATDTDPELRRLVVIVDELMEHQMGLPATDSDSDTRAYSARSRGLLVTVLLATAEHARPIKAHAALLHAIAAVYRELCRREGMCSVEQPLFEPDKRVDNVNGKDWTQNLF